MPHVFQGNTIIKGVTRIAHKCLLYTIHHWVSYFKTWAVPGLFFFIFDFSMQLTVNKCFIYKFADDRMQTAVLWCQKRPLYQLSHNTALFILFYVINCSFQVGWKIPSTSKLCQRPHIKSSSNRNYVLISLFTSSLIILIVV